MPLISSKVNIHRPNFALLITVLILVLLGTIIISSASVVLGQQNAGDPNFYFKKHLLSLILGVGLFAFGYVVDYTFWRKLAPVTILASLAMMVMVFIPGLGVEVYGAKRWVDIGFWFAPAEIFKISLIIYLAAWFEKKGKDVKNFFSSTLPFLVIIGISALLIMLQPDLGTLMVVSVTAGIMYFVAGANLSHVITMGVAGVASVIGLILTSQYRMARLMIFLNPSADTGGKGYQINQALLAIGSGGLFGVGFGHSRQKFNYLPEAATDSVFAVTAEELGFFRTAFIIFVFLIFALQGYRIAQKAPDGFSRLLAVGITTWVTVQAFLNIAVMLSLIPLTGIPLPFISMGSTSTVVLLLGTGILLNISKHTEGESRENRSLRRRNWWTYLTGFSSN